MGRPWSAVGGAESDVNGPSTDDEATDKEAYSDVEPMPPPSPRRRRPGLLFRGARRLFGGGSGVVAAAPDRHEASEKKPILIRRREDKRRHAKISDDETGDGDGDDAARKHRRDGRRSRRRSRRGDGPSSSEDSNEEDDGRSRRHRRRRGRREVGQHGRRPSLWGLGSFFSVMNPSSMYRRLESSRNRHRFQTRRMLFFAGVGLLGAVVSAAVLISEDGNHTPCNRPNSRVWSTIKKRPDGRCENDYGSLVIVTPLAFLIFFAILFWRAAW